MIFRRCPPQRTFFPSFVELSTKVAFAKAAFDTSPIHGIFRYFRDLPDSFGDFPNLSFPHFFTYQQDLLGRCLKRAERVRDTICRKGGAPEPVSESLKPLLVERIIWVSLRRAIEGTLNTQAPERVSKNPVWFPEGS